MKLTHYAVMGLLAAGFALAGCGKSEEQAAPKRAPGVVELGQLQQAFPAPTPEIASSLEKLAFSTRYRQFVAALTELDKLSKLPDLTEPQRKAVNEAIEQVKVAIQTAPAPPAQ